MLVVGLTVSLAACGGSGDLTATQTRSRARAMCAAAVQGITPAFANLGSGPGETAGQIVKLARTGAYSAERINEGLRGLKAPASLSVGLRSLIALNASTAGFERQLADAFANRPAGQQVASSEVDRYYQPVNQQASKAELLAATSNLPDLCVARI